MISLLVWSHVLSRGSLLPEREGGFVCPMGDGSTSGGQTNRCKNVTFPQLHKRVVKIQQVSHLAYAKIFYGIYK